MVRRKVDRGRFPDLEREPFLTRVVFFARGMKKELRFDKPCAGKDILQIST